VLYQYEMGAIDDENLSAFCETLYPCLGTPPGDEEAGADLPEEEE